MNNEDIIYYVMKFRNLNDTILNSYISKNIYAICNELIFTKLNVMYFFKRFKKRTVFPKRRKPRTYYTLKNLYITPKCTQCHRKCIEYCQNTVFQSFGQLCMKQY